MENYTDMDRKSDFDYFTCHYQEFFNKYGYKFLAIKNKEILGEYDSISEAIEDLSPDYAIGNYIIQECTGDESAYRTTIMRLIISG